MKSEAIYYTYIYLFFFADVGISKTSIFPHVAELSIPVLTGSESMKT